MPCASSPISYPYSSSPPPAKRQRPVSSVKLAQARRSKTVGGFLAEDSDEDDDFSTAQPATKRRLLEGSISPAPRKQHENHNGVQGLEEAVTSQTRKEPIWDIPKDHGNEEEGLSEMPSNRNVRVSQAAQEDPASRFQVPEINRMEKPELPSFQLPEVPRMAASVAVPILATTKTAKEVTISVSGSSRTARRADAMTCSGKTVTVRQRQQSAAVPFEQLVAERSKVKAGRAKRSFYGVDIHSLIDTASKETAKEKSRRPEAMENVLSPSVEDAAPRKLRRTLMWTEKYRARSFMELVGDDRTHRQVLRWLKAWDPIVFPKAGKTKPGLLSKGPGEAEEKSHRKILLLTGPPGLGKTTLAHVCARQAGYEVMEINASDERSSNVVKGRIKTSVGTQSVKTGSTVTTASGDKKKADHPLCVVVDEVDGVVGGSGGSGEGGFVKALIDLILLDQKNSHTVSNTSTGSFAKKKKQKDDFKLLRPLILICNDVYHPSLRPLRQSNFAEIIHIRKPPLDAVVTRMQSVFAKEGVSCDSDAVRRLCEATWGVSAQESRKGKGGTGEGDLRGIMVVGEWAAARLKAATKKGGTVRLTRKWVEDNMMTDLSHGGSSARGVGRGGAKDVVTRVFLEGAGFPKAAAADIVPSRLGDGPQMQLGVAELTKKAGMDRLREMVDMSGDVDRIVTDIFSEYPGRPFNDDSILSKPDAAYEWLHFHDTCSSKVFAEQAFELGPYLSQPVLACHHLFASPVRQYQGTSDFKKWGEEEPQEDPIPFTGPRADYEAFEASKSNRASILALQSSLNATLLRSFRSPEDIATDLLPYLIRMLTPGIKPMIVGGSGDQKGIASVRKESEKAMVKRSVDVMNDVGVIFERGKVEGDFGNRAAQWVYRMEPPLDTLVNFETADTSTMGAPAPIRYAVRQVLDQEYQKNVLVRENAARQARYRAANPDCEDVEISTIPETQDPKSLKVAAVCVQTKKDFFGRIIREDLQPFREIDGNAEKVPSGKVKEDNKIWVTFHEGFSNAVRKPITIDELMKGL